MSSRVQPTDLAVTREGTFVLAGFAPDQRGEGQPLHCVDADGSIKNSFGGPVSVRPGMAAAAQRVVAADRETGVWASRPDRYELEHFSAHGKRIDRISRFPDWFPDRPTSGTRRTWQDPPPSRIRDLFVDALGRVWVLAAAAKKGWKASPSNFGGIETDAENVDTMIEVIVPSTKRVVTSGRFEWSANQFTSTGALVSYRFGPDGVMVIDILKPSLVAR